MSTCHTVECCDASPLNQSNVSRTVYWNEAQTATAHCPEGETGDAVTVTKAANTVQSYISVDDANAIAYAQALTEAAAGLTCNPVVPPVYWNTEQSVTATCHAGQEGDPVTATVAAHTYSSSESVAAANAVALAAATVQANAGLVCGAHVYWNAEQCASCPLPSTDTYCVAAHTYSSEVSQADADSQAMTVAEANLECSIAGQLSGLRWDMPITGGTYPNYGTCSDPADQTTVLEGTPGHTYNVKLRFRGVVEMKNYINGTVDYTANAYAYIPEVDPVFVAGAGAFQVGGIVDPAYNPGANEYCLIVSDPPQTYWLNRLVNNVWAGQPVMLDYQVIVPMKGGSTITLRTHAVDGLELMNVTMGVGGLHYSQMIVPDVTNLLPNTGQFIQMDVVEIT